MFKRVLSLATILCFALNTMGPMPEAHADSVLGLPAPGAMVNLSPAYEPALIKGLTVHKDNPFLFDFIVDTGHSDLTGDALKKEGDRLVKYFFACLTIPEKDLWVNLSPYEKSRMIPHALGQTALGRDLLAQDYILKQLTASLIYPEKNLGKEFWNRVYAKAQEKFGTTQIPVNTFNKVWIMADKASVYEHNQTAFVLNGHLKVMLEEDYLALQKHAVINKNNVILSEAKDLKRSLDSSASPQNDSHSIASQIVREIVLPEIEKEVNTGKNFATLRQIYNSLILASWYKNNLKEALITQVYANKSTVKGVNLADPSVKERIYQQYLKAYKKGVFNYIKEEPVSLRGAEGDAAISERTTIARKYFSGGFDVAPDYETTYTDKMPGSRAMITGAVSKIVSAVVLSVALFLNQVNPALAASPQRATAQVHVIKTSSDAAMKNSYDFILGPGKSGNVHIFAQTNGAFRAVYDVKIEGEESPIEIVIRKDYVNGGFQGINVSSDSQEYEGKKVESTNYTSELRSKLGGEVVLTFVPTPGRPQGEVTITNKTGKIISGVRTAAVGPINPSRFQRSHFGSSGGYRRRGDWAQTSTALSKTSSDAAMTIEEAEAKAEANADAEFVAYAVLEEYRDTESLLQRNVLRDLYLMAIDASDPYSLEVFPRRDEAWEIARKAMWSLPGNQKNMVLARIAQEEIDSDDVLRMDFDSNKIRATLKAHKVFKDGRSALQVTNKFGSDVEFDNDEARKFFTKLLLNDPSPLKVLNPKLTMDWEDARFFFQYRRVNFADSGLDGFNERDIVVIKKNGAVLILTSGTPAALEYESNLKREALVMTAKDYFDAAMYVVENQLKIGVNGIVKTFFSRINPNYSPLLVWGDDRVKVSVTQLNTQVVPSLSTAFYKNLPFLTDELSAKGLRLNGLDSKQNGEHRVEFTILLSRFDKAALANSKPNLNLYGGIDLSTSGMSWKISKDGHGVEIDIDPAMIARIKREGIKSLSPVIFKVTPVASIWSMVGLQAPVK